MIVTGTNIPFVHQKTTHIIREFVLNIVLQEYGFETKTQGMLHLPIYLCYRAMHSLAPLFEQLILKDSKNPLVNTLSRFNFAPIERMRSLQKREEPDIIACDGTKTEGYAGQDGIVQCSMYCHACT
jgi:hypothetical protein